MLKSLIQGLLLPGTVYLFASSFQHKLLSSMGHLLPVCITFAAKSAKFLCNTQSTLTVKEETLNLEG